MADQRPTSDAEIGGRVYRSTALPAGKALSALPRLLLLLGSELLKLLLRDDDSIDKALADEDMRAGFMLLLAENAEHVDVDKLARDLIFETMIRNADDSWSSIDFDHHFAANLRLLFDVAVQSIRLSFSRPLLNGSPSQSSPGITA